MTKRPKILSLLGEKRNQDIKTILLTNSGFAKSINSSTSQLPKIADLKGSKKNFIVKLAREKVIREGWHTVSLRGLNRLLKQESIRYESYFSTKIELGVALADEEYFRFAKIIDKIKKAEDEQIPSLQISQFSQTLIQWSRSNQNLLDVILSQEVIEYYQNTKAQTGFTSFVQNMYELFYRYYSIEQKGLGTSPYELLRIWFYFFFGLSRGQIFPLVEQLTSHQKVVDKNGVETSNLLALLDRLLKSH